VNERTFQQEFVERFKAEAPEYPQPLADYRPIPGQHFYFDLAWPEKKIAVEIEPTDFSLRYLVGWNVFPLARHDEAALKLLVEDVRSALDA
jgi:hypothetical protein